MGLEGVVATKQTKGKFVGAIDDLLRLSSPYFELKEFEKDGRLYEWLGVKAFRKFIPFTGDYSVRLIRKFTPRYRLFKGRNSLEKNETATREVELIHSVAFAVVAPVIIYSLVQGNYIWAAIGGAYNLLGNLYPALTQRYMRSRINQLLERRRNQKDRTTPPQTLFPLS